MEQTKKNLNLARKWRPKTFHEVIGQKISIQMLQNALYLNKLFPVYLFSGQRGCGKTSTARILGAAINCKNINKFREDPQNNKIPCLKCESCKAMNIMNHPDFIEIDAASHTGVENVRQILEACSYMPILGEKKIYLIDEAHMLSKAAFNAFLKILEEPPSTALFILATTEIQKFPETVLSRCFQVVFKFINNEDLEKHLKQICINEKIEIENEAIKILIQETQGSVRDSINLLEQVRFSQTKVTTESLLKVLGKISETELLNLCDILIEQDAKKLLEKLNTKTFKDIDPSNLWNMMIQLIRSLLWLKFEASNIPSYFNDINRLKNLAQRISLSRLNAIFQLFWSQESIFLKTSQKQIFLETVLLQICQQTDILDLKEIVKNFKIITNDSKEEISTSKLNSSSQTKLREPSKIINTSTKGQNLTDNKINNPWQKFLKQLSQINDPFLLSILNQAKFINFDKEQKLVEIGITNNSPFVQEAINENKNLWIKHLQAIFTNAIGFKFSTIKNNFTNKNQVINKQPNNNVKSNFNKFPLSSFRNVKNIDISDKEAWPIANLIAKHFPGKIKKA